MDDTSTEINKAKVKPRYKKSAYISQVSRAATKIIENELKNDPTYATEIKEKFSGALNSVSHIKARK